MRRLLIANALLFLLAGPAPAQWNDDAEKCAETSIPDLTLARCTRAIQSGELSEPSMAVTLNNRGNAYQNKGDYARAIADYDQAIKLHSDSALIYSNRGRAHQQRGDYERAIQDYEQAIRLDPTSARGFTNRGRVYHLKENYAQAIEDYDKAIALDPAFQLAFYHRAFARFDQGLFTASVPDFARAVQLDPSRTYRVLGLYLAKARAGDVDRKGLASNAARLDLARWPGPVVALFTPPRRGPVPEVLRRCRGPHIRPCIASRPWRGCWVSLPAGITPGGSGRCRRAPAPIRGAEDDRSQGRLIEGVGACRCRPARAPMSPHLNARSRKPQGLPAAPPATCWEA